MIRALALLWQVSSLGGSAPPWALLQSAPKGARSVFSGECVRDMKVFVSVCWACMCTLCAPERLCSLCVQMGG